MTETENLVNTLRDFTNLFCPIWLWKLDCGFNVIHSDCPHESLFRSLLLKDGRREAIEKHMSVSTLPVCYTVSSLLSWLMAFGTENGSISSIYLMGPFFVGRNDPETYSEYLRPMKLSKEADETLREGLRSLPVMSTSETSQTAVILHYCIRGEKISMSDVAYYVSTPKHHRGTRNLETNQFDRSSGRWELEEKLLSRVRQGDLSAAEALSEANETYTISAFGKTDGLLAARRNIHQLLTLVSRAAVDGGLPQKTAFSLCTDYRAHFEKCHSLQELELVSREMVCDYASRVREMKNYSGCSPQIRLCCEYINTHPGEKLTLEVMADKAGYSPFHLSRKFRQEMNCSIIEYIQKSKIEHAKYLLANTKQSVDDISADLGFNSRSYFTTVFKNLVGTTPMEFRKAHAKI